MADTEDGVWRTIGGRRVFIKKGQDLSSAMKESGKFKKKKKDEEDERKTTENKEELQQGNSNRKEVRERIQNHILEYFEDEDDSGKDPEEALVRQMDAMKYGDATPYQLGKQMAEDGFFLIYNDEIGDFLDNLKINPKGKKFSEDKTFEMYTNLIARESARIYEKHKKKN